ncbi:TPA: spore coat protein U domain-containing protein [Kluyvera georgiana]
MWLRVLILLAGLCFFPLKSFAVSCTVNAVSSVNFSAVNPIANTDATTSMTFNYTCTKVLIVDTLAGYTICFNVGANGTNTINTRKMTGPGGGTLNYQLYYQDSGGAKIIWGNESAGSGTSPKDYMNLLNLVTITGSLTVYATIPSGQTSVVPGTYTDTYSAATASITVNGSLIAAPTTCGQTIIGSFPFTVTATVNKQCNVSATNTINMGSVLFNQTNVPGQNVFTMACTNTTPYTIGLSPSNGSATGSGVMKSQTSSTTNTDLVPYQLNSTASVPGTAWGNITSSNTIAGTGTGQSVNQKVYAVVPSANYRPDTYTDTVTINVTY